VNKHFQAKVVKYQHLHIIETTVSIESEFCTVKNTPPNTHRVWSKHSHNKWKIADDRHFEQVISSTRDGRPFGHDRHGPKTGGGCCAGSPSNTMWLELSSTSVPSCILIHPAVC